MAKPEVPDEMLSPLARYLRQLRKSLDLSIREFAEKCGMSTSTYVHYESPKFKRPEIPSGPREKIVGALLRLNVPKEKLMMFGRLTGEDPAVGQMFGIVAELMGRVEQLEIDRREETPPASRKSRRIL